MKHTQKSPSALRVKISEKEGVPQINVPISLLDAHGHLLDLSLHLVGADTRSLALVLHFFFIETIAYRSSASRLELGIVCPVNRRSRNVRLRTLLVGVTTARMPQVASGGPPNDVAAAEALTGSRFPSLSANACCSAALSLSAAFSNALEIGGRLRPAHLRNGLFPVL
jgi:hypothetical protein